MSIQNISTSMAQTQVQEEAAIRLQAMTLDTIKEASADLSRLMESAQAITDPARGSYLDLFA